MLLYLLIVVCIVILMFNCVVYGIEHKCPKGSLKISHLYGSKYRPFRSANNDETLGLFTTVIRFDRYITCGVYTALTIYGNIMIFVSKFSNDSIGYVCALSDIGKKRIGEIEWFEMWKFTKVNFGNNFIKNYNAGCC